MDEAHLPGGSRTRQERLVETLGLSGISRSRVPEVAWDLNERVEAFRHRPLGSAYHNHWLEPPEVELREAGRVVNVPVVGTTGVHEIGSGEVFGGDVFPREEGATWLAFLRGLVARGLHWVRLAISTSLLRDSRNETPAFAAFPKERWG